MARRQKERDAAGEPDQQHAQLVGPRRVQLADERHGADLHGYERSAAQHHSTQVAAGAGEFRRHVRRHKHEGVSVVAPGLRDERLRDFRRIGVITNAFRAAREPARADEVVDAAAGPEDVDGVGQAAASGGRGAGEDMWMETPAPGEPRGALPTEVNAGLSDGGI
ncbi:hypothetical protein EJB05_20952, partial [Eragrostis curvula]